MTTKVTETKAMTFPKAALIASFKRDFKKLDDEQKSRYVHAVCTALNIPTPLNPFYFIPAGGKEQLYASSEAAQLIANRNNITCEILSRDTDTNTGMHTVRVRAHLKKGRFHDNIGVVSIAGLTGEGLANALMKAVTKAIRRTVLSAVGLSIAEPEREDDGREAEYVSEVPPVVPKELPVETQTSDEAEQLKGELFAMLISEHGLFPGKPSMAAEWILKESTKEYEALDANDANDLLEKAEIEMQDRKDSEAENDKQQVIA